MGYACRSHCSDMPCRARLTSKGRGFKLSVLVHSATLEALDGPGVLQNQRPYVAVSVGDKVKETELADWSKERGQWRLNEVITVEVHEDDELSVVVSCSSRYDLLVAQLALTSRQLGGFCVPISQVLPRLKQEDRDVEGIVYATPVIPFDVTQEGRPAGRVHISFETKSPPPTIKAGGTDSFCGFSERVAMNRLNSEAAVSDLDSTCRSTTGFHQVVTFGHGAGPGPGAAPMRR